MTSLLFILTIPFLIACAAVSYYFFWSLPNKQQEEYIAQKQTQCLNMQPAIIALVDDSHSPQASNHYNSSSNKCYVEVFDSYYSGDSVYPTYVTDDFLYDAVENNILLKSVSIDNIAPGQSSKENDVFISFIQNTNGDNISSSTYETLEHGYMNQ
jgi:hypothetical protein